MKITNFGHAVLRSAFGVSGFKFQVQGSRFKVSGSRFKVQSSRLSICQCLNNVDCFFSDLPWGMSKKYNFYFSQRLADESQSYAED